MDNDIKFLKVKSVKIHYSYTLVYRTRIYFIERAS